MDVSLPSTSTSSCPALDILDKGLYLNNHFMPVADVKSKLVEFSNFWNSTGRISLLNATKEDSEEIVYLLLTLKKNIKYTLSEVGKCRIRKNDDFQCTECNTNIHVRPNEHIWTCLQAHEHFEELFFNVLNGSLPIENLIQSRSTEVLESIPALSNTCSKFDQNNVENVDSGIEHCESIANGDETHSSEDEGINTFRFNFTLRYDEAVVTKLYPETLMKSVHKMDRIQYFTIQKSGPFRAVCLICNCEIISRGRVHKMIIMDHIAGQRHLKSSRIITNLNLLQKYHELFLNLDSDYQAHQNYFGIAGDDIFKCILCRQQIPASKVVDHIMSLLHKKFVLDMFNKNMNNYYLVNMQVKVYGVTEEQVVVKQNSIENSASKTDKVEKSEEKERKIKKQDSDSNYSPDTKESEHEIVKSVEDPNSTSIRDLIPHRYKGHKTILKETKTTLLCYACKQHIEKNIDIIKKHLRSNAHRKFSNILTPVYNFYCEICDMQFSDENTWSKHFTDGPNGHVGMAESRKSKATEYECINCCLVIYGDDISLIRHKVSKGKRERRSAENKVTILPEAVKQMFSSPDAISTEGLSLTKEAKYMLENNDKTMECCKHIEAILKTVFEDIKAYPFGSRMSGLGNKLSDLDVFIDTGGMFNGNKNQDSYTQVQIVRKAGNALIRQKDMFQEVFLIPTARTPIVKLLHRRTQISCDLSFRHGLSVENTKFLRFCIEIQPITQPFILLLKKWSAINKLSEHITTYALAIMAIFYLQVNSYLLSVKKIKELNSTGALVINGWETINYTVPIEIMRNHVNTYEHSLHRLLRDFFQYYANFCYNEDRIVEYIATFFLTTMFPFLDGYSYLFSVHEYDPFMLFHDFNYVYNRQIIVVWQRNSCHLMVVCPLLGYTIKKNLFHGKDERLPPEMHSYVQQMKSSDPEQFRSLSYFCIQDPFDLSHNLTKACQPNTVQKLRTLSELSAKHLSSSEFPY